MYCCITATCIKNSLLLVQNDCLYHSVCLPSLPWKENILDVLHHCVIDKLGVINELLCPTVPSCSANLKKEQPGLQKMNVTEYKFLI